MSESDSHPEAMVEFFGGPLDGKVLATDELGGEFDPNKVFFILSLVASSLDKAAREERKPENLLTWRVPHRMLLELTNTEQWSEAKRKALLQQHEYHVNAFEECEGLVFLKARYRGCN